MKDTLNGYIDTHQEEIKALGRELFIHPELGYKEFETKKIIVETLKKHGIRVEKEYFETGFQVSIGSGKPHIGLLAELDAIPVETHPCANPADHAAHACGHSSQVTIMLAALIAMKETGVFEKMGKVTLFFTPAEEYTDLDYRRKLMAEGKIKAVGGKVNMLLGDIFEGADCLIHLHAMSDTYAYGYNISLAGFKYKRMIFKGKAAHAGVLPHLGVNALNEFTLFNSALGMLRETFEEKDRVRVHGLVTKGGDAINSIPSEVVYECYIRSVNDNKLLELDKRISNMAIHCAKALGGDVVFEDMAGYMPFKPNKVLSEVTHQNMLNFVDESQILADEESIAGGDIGDVSLFYPTTQFGYTGFKGVLHGADFEIIDENKAYLEPAKIVCGTVADLFTDKKLLREIQACHRFMDKEKYLAYLEKESSK